MAALRLSHAELTVPASPRLRLSTARLSVPEPKRMRLSYAAFTTPSTSGTAKLRLSYAALTTPAAPDALPASGLWQLQDDGTWRAVPVFQLVGGVWQ